MVYKGVAISCCMHLLCTYSCSVYIQFIESLIHKLYCTRMKNSIKVLILGVICFELTVSKIFSSKDVKASQAKGLPFKELKLLNFTQVHTRKRRTTVGYSANVYCKESTTVLNLPFKTNELLTPNACKPVTHVSQPVDCYNIYEGCPDAESGIYSIQPQGYPQPFEVYCDMDTDGGGWTVFQRREDGSIDFLLGWAAYKNGFGRLGGEFWLGNEKIFFLTTQRKYELRIELVNNAGDSYYAKYDNFRIGQEALFYRLIIGSYSGNAGGDRLALHRGRNFTTIDRDNDNSTANCAVRYTGAWWYNSCHHSNLNGVYDGEGYNSIHWNGLPGSHHRLRGTEMKIRPKQQA